MQVELRRPNKTKDPRPNLGPQQQRFQVSRPPTLKKDETQTRISPKRENPRKWVPHQLQEGDQRSSIHQRAQA